MKCLIYYLELVWGTQKSRKTVQLLINMKEMWLDWWLALSCPSKCGGGKQRDQPKHLNFTNLTFNVLNVCYELTCLNVNDLNLSFPLFVSDSGIQRMMKTTSAKATRLAVIITMFSLSVSISIPAPRAGDMIREAAKPAVTSPYPRLLSEIIHKS